MKEKILILDDDKDILEILTIILSESGYEIKTLSCGDSIFEELIQFEPNILLMDIMIADMDGLAICREIKENALTSSIPVIIISASHDLDKSLNLPGAPDDFLAKPFDIDFLLNKIEKYVKV